MKDEQELSHSGLDKFSRLKWVISFRLILASLVPGIALIIYYQEEKPYLSTPLIGLYFLVGFTYFFSLVSFLSLKRVASWKWFSYLQLIWDVLFVCGVLYFTKIWESSFSFLFLMGIINSGILLFRWGAFWAVVLSTGLYVGLVMSVYLGYMPVTVPPHKISGWVFLLQDIIYKLIAFFATGIAVSYVTEKLRRTSDELLETQAGLDQLELLNETIIRSIGSGLLTLDDRKKITSFNLSAEKITGWKAEEALGRELEDIFNLPALSILLDQQDNSFPQKKRFSYKNKMGKDILLEISVQNLYNQHNQTIGKLVIFSDVSQWAEMEEKLRVADRLAVVGRLAAGIAHEIRNPLAAISGSVQLMALESSEEDKRKLMDIVLKETDRLNRLLTDFLLYAKPSSRTIAKVDMENWVKELIRLTNHQFCQDEKAKMEIELYNEQGLYILTDPNLLDQIYWNLVNNAREAMPEGGSLRIELHRVRQNGREGVQLVFKDNGTGINKEHLPRIFEPFFTTKEDGTGLGLSIVWRIVKELGGDIEVESKEGRGSCFRVWLPQEFKIQEWAMER